MPSLFSAFSHPFFLVAFFTGISIALVSALVGTHLSLKGFSMIGDGLSHISFGAVAIAAAVGFAPLSVSIPVVICAAFLLLRLSENSAAKADSAIAMLSAMGLAVGIVSVNLAGVKFDLNAYLFGSLFAVSREESLLILVLCALLFVFYLFCYPRLFLLTYDESFLVSLGKKASLWRTVLSLLCAVVVVLGMRAAGALLTSALLIFPPQSAMNLSRSFSKTVVFSALVGVFSFVFGFFCAYLFNLPTGAAVVCAQGAVYLVTRLVRALFLKKR